MNSIVWENLLLAMPFVAAFVGVPMWMTIRHPDASG